MLRRLRLGHIQACFLLAAEGRGFCEFPGINIFPPVAGLFACVPGLNNP